MERIKQIGKEWKEMSAQDKQFWNIQAQKAKDKYKEQVVQYKKMSEERAKNQKEEEEVEEVEEGDKSDESLKENEELKKMVQILKDKKSKRKLFKQQQQHVKVFY